MDVLKFLLENPNFLCQTGICFFMDSRIGQRHILPIPRDVFGSNQTSHTHTECFLRGSEKLKNSSFFEPFLRILHDGLKCSKLSSRGLKLGATKFILAMQLETRVLGPEISILASEIRVRGFCTNN